MIILIPSSVNKLNLLCLRPWYRHSYPKRALLSFLSVCLFEQRCYSRPTTPLQNFSFPTKCGQCIDSLDEPQMDELRKKDVIVHVIFRLKNRLHFRQAESFQTQCTKHPASADIPSWQRCSDWKIGVGTSSKNDGRPMNSPRLKTMQ